jgi:hypothetical protein
LRAFGGAGFAAMPRADISEVAAPATRAVENARLFIIMILPPWSKGLREGLPPWARHRSSAGAEPLMSRRRSPPALAGSEYIERQNACDDQRRCREDSSRFHVNLLSPFMISEAIGTRHGVRH